MGFLNEDYQDFLNLLHEDELVEEPVPLEVFLYDKQFMGLKKVSELQGKIIEILSQIYLPSTLEKLHGPEEAKRIWEQDTVNELVCQLGKGSGKDFSTRIGFCYA